MANSMSQDQQTTLLIVDDDLAVRESMAAWLEVSGYTVFQAADGISAIEHCRLSPPELMLCDLQMPNMNGLQVLAIMAKEFPNLPVVMLSGQGDMSDVIQSLKLGAWDYVTKPIIDIEMLERAMQRCLERAKLIQENCEYQRNLEAANVKLHQALEHMSADEQAGRELQFQMLPENGAQFDQLQFFYRLLSSSTLSGDFVDYFRIDGNHIGFYLADVAGHGIPSALVTVILKNTMGRFLNDCWQQGDHLLLDPQQTLSKLNNLFLEGGLHKHVAMFYGVIALTENKLIYSSAGHFPHAILFEQGSARYEGYKSPPAGLFSQASYPSHECVLHERFALLLISDGIFEIMPQPSLLEKEAALLAMIDSEGLNLDDLIQTLGISTESSDLPDDITFLLLKR